MARRTRKPVARPSAFWDTSALLPLCVRQGTTPAAIALYKKYELVVWWMAPVEIASAIARLRRMQQIDSGDSARARKLAKELGQSWSMVQPSAALRSLAEELVERYELRALDAMQLAAALQWCENSPAGRVFLSSDLRLHQAALLAGFDSKQV